MAATMLNRVSLESKETLASRSCVQLPTARKQQIAPVQRPDLNLPPGNNCRKTSGEVRRDTASLAGISRPGKRATKLITGRRRSTLDRRLFFAFLLPYGQRCGKIAECFARSRTISQHSLGRIP